MQVVGGRHKGLACRVEELLPQREGRSSEWLGWGWGGLRAALVAHWCSSRAARTLRTPRARPLQHALCL